MLKYAWAAAGLIENNATGVPVELYDVAGIEAAFYDAFKKFKLGVPLKISRRGIEKYDRKILTEKFSGVLNQLV